MMSDRESSGVFQHAAQRHGTNAELYTETLETLKSSEAFDLDL